VGINDINTGGHEANRDSVTLLGTDMSVLEDFSQQKNNL